MNGIPQQYNDEYIRIIKDVKEGKTKIKDIDTLPDFFQAFGIEENPDFWINKQISRYYNVENVILVK